MLTAKYEIHEIHWYGKLLWFSINKIKISIRGGFKDLKYIKLITKIKKIGLVFLVYYLSLHVFVFILPLPVFVLPLPVSAPILFNLFFYICYSAHSLNFFLAKNMKIIPNSCFILIDQFIIEGYESTKIFKNHAKYYFIYKNHFKVKKYI